jgi:hypothetical protein
VPVRVALREAVAAGKAPRKNRSAIAQRYLMRMTGHSLLADAVRRGVGTEDNHLGRIGPPGKRKACMQGCGHRLGSIAAARGVPAFETVNDGLVSPSMSPAGPRGVRGRRTGWRAADGRSGSSL